MFHERLKMFRQKKNLSQEGLAERLNVVRQTVSKWEKGTSAPDADMLIKISEELGVSANELLGMPESNEAELSGVSESLAAINEQLYIKNRRTQRIWKTITVILFALISITAVIMVMNYLPA